MIRSVIRGVGRYLPENALTNEELSHMVETSDEWIRTRTGIRRRHIAAEGEMTSDLALAASREALSNAGMDAQEIDLIILATCTPDQTFPSTATRLQAMLGITHGAAFDVQAVCSGFVFAMATADNFLKAGQAKNCLVVGSETLSRITNWEDRTTCVLFGDGAGAVVLSAQEGKGTIEDRGILTSHLRSDGRYNKLLYVDGGPSSTQTVGFMNMDGPEVFKHAVTKMADAIKIGAESVGLELSDIDWFVPHQANQRILDATAKRLGIDPDKVVSTVVDQGNTSAASIPLALGEAMDDGRIKEGDLVLAEALGGGFTWGSAVIRM